MSAIEDMNRDKVILLPQTIDYYQEELTRLLETERYREAEELLSFLLNCRSFDPRTAGEWASLLEWLRTAFPADLAGDGEEEALTEQELHKQRISAKQAHDPNYVKRLLEVLLGDAPLARKMDALEQLAAADHPQIDDTLRRWLEQVDLHPLVQFKVLQTLCARGAGGTVRLHRCGETVDADIAATPLEIDDFPECIRAVASCVGEATEADQPNLIYFATHTWKEFLSYIYGTSLYKQLSGLDRGGIAAWAAALHWAVQEAMTGEAAPDALFGLYRLSGDEVQTGQQAYETIKSFLASVLPS